jgi:hypothetical protein
VKYPGQDDHATWSRWEVARDEYKIRHGGKPRPFNIWLDPDTGVIRRHLTPFQTLTGTVPKKLVESLHLLEGQGPMALVVQKNTREALQRGVVDARKPRKLRAAHPALLKLIEQRLAPLRRHPYPAAGIGLQNFCFAYDRCHSRLCSHIYDAEGHWHSG